MTGRQHLRRNERQQADQRTADHRPQRRLHPQLDEYLLAAATPRIRRCRRRRQADRGRRQSPRRARRASTRAGIDAEPLGMKTARSSNEQRGHADRRQRGDRIAADDQLEAIESTAQGRAEGAGDSARCAAATSTRMSLRRRRKAWPIFDAMPLASWVCRPPDRPRRQRRSTTLSAPPRSGCRASTCGRMQRIGSIGSTRSAPAVDVGRDQAEQQPADCRVRTRKAD